LDHRSTNLSQDRPIVARSAPPQLANRQYLLAPRRPDSSRL
jgi:hypothetical protein